MIIDAHVHITLKEQNAFHHLLRIEDYLAICRSIGKVCPIVFLNPFNNKFLCKKYLHDRKGHQSRVIALGSEEYGIKCEKCGGFHYVGCDVFREENVSILDLANNVGAYALAFLSAPTASVQRQVDFYEERYPDFLGYKIHPTIIKCPIDEYDISSKKTLLVHCGNDEFSAPRKIVELAKRYKGNVIVAHWARFDREVLSEIAYMDNVWVDTSPFLFLLRLSRTKPNLLRAELGNHKLMLQPEAFFQELISLVGIRKVLFASDAPFGDLQEEFSFILGADLNEADIRRITYENAIEAYAIGDVLSV